MRTLRFAVLKFSSSRVKNLLDQENHHRACALEKPHLPMIKWKLSLIVTLIIAVFISVMNGCNADGEIVHKPTAYNFPKVAGLPTMLNIPSDNPMTIEGVELGRYLFYDGRLSGRLEKDSLMSCGSCHLQSSAFECGYDKFPDGHPTGLPLRGFPNGKRTPHVMLPVVNLAFNNNGYMWNGFLEHNNTMTGIPGYDFSDVPNPSFTNLEAFTYMAIVAKHEMNGSLTRTVETIGTDSRYPPMFLRAFGSGQITAERISQAISQFIRSIVSYRSRYHGWLRGEEILTVSEQRGYSLFFSEKADCFHCHGGSSMMTTYDYYNNAKDSVFTDIRDRYSITGKIWDTGAYRAPSLINVEMNGPYMHDGRFKTLEEVINFYSDGLVYSPHVHPMMKFVHNGGVHLTNEEKSDLKAFLLTLTDHALLTEPAYAPPADLDEWVR
jgi:cytochrome c peroxidase